MAAPYLYFIKTTIPLSIRFDLLNFCEAGTAPSLHSFSSIAYLCFGYCLFFCPKWFFPPSIDTRTAPNQIIGG